MSVSASEKDKAVFVYNIMGALSFMSIIVRFLAELHITNVLLAMGKYLKNFHLYKKGVKI